MRDEEELVGGHTIPLLSVIRGTALQNVRRLAPSEVPWAMKVTLNPRHLHTLATITAVDRQRSAGSTVRLMAERLHSVALEDWQDSLDGATQRCLVELAANLDA